MKATKPIAIGTHKFYWKFNMTDEIRPNPAEMLRQTSTNISNLFLQIADHIEILEERIKELEAHIGNNTTAQ